MKASLCECIVQGNKFLLENVKNDPAFLSFALSTEPHLKKYEEAD